MKMSDSFGIEVIIPDEENKVAPRCPHGPALLFQKLPKGQEKGKRFYACSACRDRKDCNFFQWEDETISEARTRAREEQNQLKTPSFSHEKYCSRFREFVCLPLDQRKFCQDCELLLLPGEWATHTSHTALSDITVAKLRRPSVLLCPLENKKSNAQYLFADRSCHFLLDQLSGLAFRKILCVGTPRLHELIKIRNLEGKNEPIRTLLLDIDFRYAQFYEQKEFCHYNMFNHHFFNGEKGERELLAFLSEEEGGKVVLVTDPPFGGLVKPLAHSFSKISSAWKSLQPPADSSVSQMPIVWIFPYFFEPRILECFPSFSMLDYQVDYDNHPLYKHGKTGRKQSPVRLFTNLCPRDIALPEEEGYRFCSICERYVSAGNKHCPECNVCPSKDGREWRHCSECGKCVKPTWLHCFSCSRCALPAHPCGGGQTGCFHCGSQDHKLRACPNRYSKHRMLVNGAKGTPAKPRDIARRSTARKQKTKGSRWKPKVT